MKKILFPLLLTAFVYGQHTNKLDINKTPSSPGRILFEGNSTAPTSPTSTNVNVFNRNGKLLCKDASNNDCWSVTNSAGTDVPISNISGALVSVKDYGAVGNGVADDTVAIQNAIAAGPSVFFPCGDYKITAKISLSTGKTITGCGPANHWRGSSGTRLVYYGTDRALEIKPPVSTGYDTINIIDIEINGVNATGSAMGLVIDGSASGAYVEGVYTSGMTISDFPSYQMYGTGLIFMLSYHNSTFININRPSGDHTIFFGNNQYRSQVYFYDCNIGQYAVGKWAFKEELSTRVSFYGGTIFMAGLSGSNGAHGVWVNGGLDLYGTSVEGLPAATASQTAVRYTGSNGANIQGTVIASAIGVEIGDPASKSTPAIWAVLSGNIGNNVTDVQIWDGGSRIGTTLLSLGDTATPITVVNARATTDGVYTDVLWWKFNSGLDIGAMPFTTTGVVNTGALTSTAITSTSAIGATSTITGSTLIANTGIIQGTGSNPILINNNAQSQDKVNIALRAYSSQTLPFISAQDSAGVELTRLNKGGELQLNGVAYASLPSPTNGMFQYCTDCQQTNPCASGGSGAFARREAGVWNCAGSGGGGGGTITAVNSGTGISASTVGTTVTVNVDTTTVPTFLTNTASIDFGSIAASACATSNITVTGATTGDAVAAGWPAALEAGLLGQMSVTAADTVTVRLCKITTGSVDPANATFRATIVRSF